MAWRRFAPARFLPAALPVPVLAPASSRFTRLAVCHRPPCSHRSAPRPSRSPRPGLSRPRVDGVDAAAGRPTASVRSAAVNGEQTAASSAVGDESLTRSTCGLESLGRCCERCDAAPASTSSGPCARRTRAGRRSVRDLASRCPSARRGREPVGHRDRHGDEAVLVDEQMRDADAARRAQGRPASPSGEHRPARGRPASSRRFPWTTPPRAARRS